MDYRMSDLTRDALERHQNDPHRISKKSKRLEACGLAHSDAVHLAQLEVFEEDLSLTEAMKTSIIELYRKYRTLLEPRVEKEIQSYEGKMLDLHPNREEFRRRVTMLLEIGISMAAADAVTEQSETAEVNPEQTENAIAALQRRFAEESKEYCRQEDLDIEAVVRAVRDSSLNPGALARLRAMEQSGGCPDLLAETADHFVIGECFTATPQSRRGCYFHQAEEQAKAMGVRLMGPWTFVSAFRESKEHSVDYLRSSKSLQEQGWAMEGYHGQSGSRAITTYYPSEIRQGWRGELLVKKHPKAQQ
jgi:hypothetical protein